MISTILLALAIALALTLLGLVLLAILVYSMSGARARSKPAAPPSAPKLKPLRKVFATFERSLPRERRGAPVVVVIGERLAGKSTVVAAALRRDGSDGATLPSDTSDARMSLSSARQSLILELSADFLEDGRVETQRSLDKLFRPIARRIALVVLVVDTSAPSYTPHGMRRFGARARELLDGLAVLRDLRARVRIRICLTHLDASLEGFVELADLATANGYADITLIPHNRQAASLGALLERVGGWLPRALATHSVESIGRMAQALSGSANTVLGVLEPCLEALLRSQTTAPVPVLEGMALGAFPAGRAEALIGVPLQIDMAGAAADLRSHEQRRLTCALAWAAAATAALGGLYGWRFRQLETAADAVERFVRVAKQQDGSSRHWDEVNHAESLAAVALRKAHCPAWPPLRYAYPTKRKGIGSNADCPSEKPESSEASKGEEFLGAIRERYLLPKTKDTQSLSVRVHAVTVLRASDDAKSWVGRAVLARKAEFAKALEIPEFVIADYVELSHVRWDGNWGPSGGHFQHIIDGCTELCQAEAKRIVLADSAKLAACAEWLSRAVREAESILRSECSADADKLLGPAMPEKSDRRQRSTDDCRILVDAGAEHWIAPERIKPGKSLRQFVDDLESIPCPRNGGTPNIEPDVPDSGTNAADTAIFVANLRSSQFTKDYIIEAEKSRPKYGFFFADTTGSVAGGANGRHGPRYPYTARAVEDVLAPTLGKLDGALAGACVSKSERERLSALVTDAMKDYAAEYERELWGYIGQFPLERASLSSLQKDLQDIVSATSWFGDFWTTVADNAMIDTKGISTLNVLTRRLEGLAPIAALAPEKGKPANLEKYYSILAPLIPSLDDAPIGPAGGPLAERVSPLGKLGLSLLSPSSSRPLTLVSNWLDSAKIPPDNRLRLPFLTPVNEVYRWARDSLAQAVEEAYAQEVRAIIEPVWRLFPFDPDAAAEAQPAELEVLLGPKGTLRVAFDQVIGPLVARERSGYYAPKRGPDFGPAQVPEGALALGKWTDDINALLFDEAGKPKPLALWVQPQPLSQFSPWDSRAMSKSYLVAGDARVEGFNQAALWKALSVPWTSSPAAFVGIDVTDPTTGAVTTRTRPGAGEAWPFLRLLCQAVRWQGNTVEWNLAGPVGFQVKQDPWDKLRPPGGQRRCWSRRAGETVRTKTSGAVEKMLPKREPWEP